MSPRTENCLNLVFFFFEILPVQDDLRALLLDSEDDFVRELADITPTVPDGQQQHHTPQNSPARVGVAFRGAASPPSPPPREGVGGRQESEGQGGRSPASDRRQSRRESERWGGLANATTVSSLFRRCATCACHPCHPMRLVRSRGVLCSLGSLYRSSYVCVIHDTYVFDTLAMFYPSIPSTLFAMSSPGRRDG